MAEKRKPKLHPLVTPEVIAEARQYVSSDVTDEEIAELMSDNFRMLEGWTEPEVQ